MTTPGKHTHREIMSQPGVWAAVLDTVQAQESALQALWASESFSSVIFTGCGSTYYTSLSAASLARELLRVPACAYPGSELWLNPNQAYIKEGKTLLVAISRSAKTTETFNAIKTFKAAGRGSVVSLSCYHEPEWAELCDLNLLFPAAQEESVAQTRAFSALHLAATAITAIFAGQSGLFDALGRLPDVAQTLITGAKDLAGALGRAPQYDRYYFLGSGPRHGLACELSLKMKEMSLSHSEPFHFLEFRHGPISMVTDSTLVVGLVSEAHKDYELAVLEDARKLGARVLSLGERDTEVAFESGLPDAARNILILPVGQLLAFEHAIAKGLNPDRPTNLQAVVELK